MMEGRSLVQKKPRTPRVPQEPKKEPQPSAPEAAPDNSPSSSEPAEAAALEPAADQRDAKSDDEMPTTPLKESVDRARQILAARKTASSGSLPAITPEVLRAAQQTNGSASADAANFSQRLQERRRGRITRLLPQSADGPTEEALKLEADHAPQPPAPAPEEMTPALEAAALEVPAGLAPAAEEMPVTEEPAAALASANGHRDQPTEEALTPSVASAGSNGHRDQPTEEALTPPVASAGSNGNGARPGASNGKPRITAKMTTVSAPSRTRRLPETDEIRGADAADGEMSDFGERMPARAALSLALGAHPRTEPLPAIGISRKGLLSEGARRERTLSVRAEANRRWHRRRRYAFYVMGYQRRKQERQNTILHRAVTSVVSLVGLIILVVIGYTINDAYMFYQSQTAILNNLPNVTSRDNAEIFDSTGKLLFKITADGVKHYIPLSQVSINVINATIATEDKDFWVNDGVDFTAIVRAELSNLNSGGITQGGSSITQQLIKNTVTGGDDTLDRKLKEAILAIGITQQYSKEQILEMYLNSIGYGENAYGIDAAALEYFNLPDKGKVTGAAQLDLAQASVLAGLPKNPNVYDPFSHLKAALDRQKVVLQAMVDQGYINEGEALQAEAEAAQPGFLQAPPQEGNLAPHFVYWIEDQLANMIDSGAVSLSLTGLRIYTTLDLDLQNKVQTILQQQIKHLTNTGQDVDNGAAVILDQHTGAVLVMLGSANYYNTSD